MLAAPRHQPRPHQERPQDQQAYDRPDRDGLENINAELAKLLDQDRGDGEADRGRNRMAGAMEIASPDAGSLLRRVLGHRINHAHSLERIERGRTPVSPSR
ncbi:MAG: hypothetical protein GDA49_10930 [Rhodospirillales bacterium]|nr:hypothetical protein [Rhodospirillales bacterium]